ncbi:MAG: anaerobic ribonucleoside-triphosphate reductase activating protein [Candidatus Aminicenantaceae bacterium]
MVEIKGIEKFAPIDFPGYISSTVFVGGCNFRCPFCHNAELVLKPQSLPTFPMDYFLSYLDSRKNWLEAVCVSGGEPLLHDELDVLLQIIKDRNLLVKIDTNGAFPEKLEELIKAGLLDSVAMDIKAPLDKYEKITAVPVDTDNVRRSIKIIQRSGLDYIFRTTVVPGFIDENDIEEIGQLLKGSKSYQIQQFKPVNTLDKTFEKIKPFGREKLQVFADRAGPYFEKVRIEGI